VAYGGDDRARWAKVPRPGSALNRDIAAVSLSVRTVAAAGRLLRGSSATAAHHPLQRSCRPV